MDMAKGYMVADLRVRDKAVRDKACDTDLFLAEGV